MPANKGRKLLGREEFEKLLKKYKNWGRWGVDDQHGTLNFISKTEIKQAGTEIRKGKIFSLAIPLNSEGPQTGYLSRFNPIHLMIRHGGDAMLDGLDEQVHSADDVVLMPLQCATHWDSLAHVFHRGRIYNNYSVREVTGSGAKKNGIELMREKIVGRGILLDIPRLKNRKSLEDGYGINSADLRRAAEREGVEVHKGDILLIRTGKMTTSKERGDWKDWRSPGIPGLTLDSIEWIAEHKISAVASDNWAVEVVPYETEKILLPFHIITIVYMGLTLGEVFDLDGLAQDCAEDGKYSFFFSAQPLPFTGAVGSPINPIAVK